VNGSAKGDNGGPWSFSIGPPGGGIGAGVDLSIYLADTARTSSTGHISALRRLSSLLRL
jgi:hypothetical protein